MRVFDIIAESKQIDEAPMGMLKTIGNKLASKMPGTIGSSAVGRLETGKVANQVKADFYKYLGQTGLEADADTIIQFLQSQGYPVAGAQAIAKKAETPAPTGSAQPVATPAQAAPSATAAKQPTGKLAPNTPDANNPLPAATAQPQAAAAPVSAPKAAPAKPAAPVQSPDAIAAKRAAKQAAATTTARAQMAANPVSQPAPAAPVDYDIPTWQRKGMTAPEMPPIKKNAKGQYLNPNGTFMKRPINAPKTSKAKESVHEAALPKSIIDKMFLIAAQEQARTAQPAAPSAAQASPGQSPASSAPAQAPAAGGNDIATSFQRGASGGANTDNTPDSNMTFNDRLSLKQVQDAALALDPSDQKKLLAFLTKKIRVATPAATPTK